MIALQTAANSIHYLIGLWARFVLDLPTLQGDLPTFLDPLIAQVTHAFVQTRLDLVPPNVKSGDLDGTARVSSRGQGDCEQR